MKEIILCKYGEIALKGLNKSTFESMMVKTIKRRLASAGEFRVTKSQSTLYVEPLGENPDVDEFETRLSKVFGIVKLCRSGAIEKDLKAICEQAPEYLAEVLEGARTFKVNARRADKKFPQKSPEICSELGFLILKRIENLSDLVALALHVAFSKSQDLAQSLDGVRLSLQFEFLLRVREALFHIVDDRIIITVGHGKKRYERNILRRS